MSDSEREHLHARAVRGRLGNGQFPTRHINGLEMGAAIDSPWCDTLDRATDVVRDGGLVAFLGKRGTGKTLMATQIARVMVEEKLDVGAHYRKAMTLFREIREAQHNGNESRQIQFFRRLGLLVIDEADERGMTDFEDRTLVHLLDLRYDAMLPTILISNSTGPEFAKQVGPSIVSRMNEHGRAFEFAWQSFRRSAS